MNLLQNCDVSHRQMQMISSRSKSERRAHRRHNMEIHRVTVERWDGRRRIGHELGEVMDLSSGGMKIRSPRVSSLRQDQQIRLRIELPAYAGISPFVDTSKNIPQPKNEWVGWLSVCRVDTNEDGTVTIAGKLVDMEEMDRGMLGLYLSTQPLAA